ncbi:MAG: c-type cytochrome [Gammaproteobacteria bacterium]|nr:c-type cytochrome [Gammaproteobacteria bacterium]MDH5309762.1 c-type cytochrome [Gammaproteobacteria bacterium]
MTLADGEPGLPGQKVYEEVCRECHEQVGASAPQTGQSPDWTERSALWQAVLFEHANQGYLEMPAKGGEEGLSEDDVAAAVEYMLNQSFPERTDDPR